MNWLQRYRIRYYVRNSVWIFPAFTILAAIGAVRLLHGIEDAMVLEANLNPETTRTVLVTLAGSMFTFTVFVCSSLLLVVQVASAQLTPRVIGTMFRDPVTKLTLSIFVFTFTFVLAALLRIGTTVPLLITHVAAWGSVASIVVFLYLIDHVGKMLRPSGVFESVASQAHRVINYVYPRHLTDAREPITEEIQTLADQPPYTVTGPGGGVVMAFDARGIAALATQNDCLIELVPQVGDFVAPGDALFRVHGGATLSAQVLRHSIALGSERTIEQDPAFAFRVIVDIASKGLSPAVNDPTTAVLAIDRIHHLLRHIGNRQLDHDKVRDAAGRVRLIYRTPGWEDFVTLAVTEIRHFGGASIQIARRLRAMLENLIETLPEVRAAPLRQQMALLKRSAERCFLEPEDKALADISDSQGVGGA